MTNILFTSAGRRSYLIKYFKNALKGQGSVHAANSDAKSPAFKVADKRIITPLIYDNNYIDFLLDYCKKNDICAIILLFDIDLLVLSRNKQRFSDIGVKLIVSDESVITKCNDKWNTYVYLTENGILVPKTFLSVEEVFKSIDSGEIEYPVIVKPRWGMGSIGVYIADNDEELQVFYNKIKKDIQNSYLKYESSNTPDQCVIIQEMLNGNEYGLDIINDLEGRYINTIVKRKYAMRSGETDCAITVDRPDMKQIGEQISKLLNHISNLDVDIFDVEGKIYVLEMNARFGGGYPFSHLAGIDLPGAIVQWLNNQPVDMQLFEPRINVMGQKDIEIIEI